MSTVSLPEPPPSPIDKPWRGLRWRLALAGVAVGLGLIGFASGVGTTDRDTVLGADGLTHLYYTLGLFIFGGMDLGTPVDGPLYGRVALWGAYFLAPAITASAVVSAVLRAVGGDQLIMQARLSGHVVVVGCDRLTRLYLRRLRNASAHTQVLVVGAPGQDAQLEELRDRFRVHVLEGRPTARVTLRKMRLEQASLALVLTSDDFTNFDVATRMLEVDPTVETKLHVHVHDLVFLRSIQSQGRSLPVLKNVFNGHERAAKRLVGLHLLRHFKRTEEQDSVVLAGFGDFGQTVLDELQKNAEGYFDRVVIVDTAVRQQAATFQDQVGFQDHYQRELLEGDIRFPEVWQRVNTYVDLGQGAPVVLIGSGDDQANVRVALTIAEQFPNALTFARNEKQWSFADSLSRVTKIRIVNVVQLVAESMPPEWFGGRPELASTGGNE